MSAAAPSFSLAGRVALVTGGNTGLGSGMAVGLASAGADIVSIGPGDPSETAAAVAAHGRRLQSWRPWMTAWCFFWTTICWRIAAMPGAVSGVAGFRFRVASGGVAGRGGDPAYLEEAYAAGCRSLFVGFESLSPDNMRSNNKAVNVAADYAAACRRFHDAGIMINGSFVFGFDQDGPDVFERTVDFAIESKLLTATFHVLTPLPGTRAFARLETQGRLLHRNWVYYDTDHAYLSRAA